MNKPNTAWTKSDFLAELLRAAEVDATVLFQVERGDLAARIEQVQSSGIAAITRRIVQRCAEASLAEVKKDQMITGYEVLLFRGCINQALDELRARNVRSLRGERRWEVIALLTDMYDAAYRIWQTPRGPFRRGAVVGEGGYFDTI